MHEPRAKAVATIKIDNDDVRVTEWRFAPGTHTGHHRHEYPYVVVPLTTGPLTLTTATGETTATLTVGEPYFRPAGIEHDVINANEASFRMMLIHSMERRLGREHGEELPIRQNRRTALIEAALEPVQGKYTREAFEMLSRALALIIGTEGMIVVKDVLQLEDEEARKVKRWAIAALVEAAAGLGGADHGPAKAKRPRS